MKLLEKELVPGITATLNEDGVLTLTERTILPEDEIDDFTQEAVTVTEISMSAQAVRALLNLLRRQAVRQLINYRPN